jgi:ABC-type multidrug transport system ATPase subunit
MLICRHSFTFSIGSIGGISISETSIIKVQDVVKRFNDVQVLDSFSLEVSPGIFGLIGPNGAGKTTLLRILLGLIRCDSGYVEMFNHSEYVSSLAIRKRVGVLHEKPQFPSYMTPISFLAHVRSLYGGGLSPDEALSLVNLTKSKNRKIGTLSAGMYQRLGIAQALISQPDLVFLDEPTSNLDVTGRTEITKTIIDIHNEQGTSFFITSHILSELETICHEIAFIKNGQIIVKGPVLDIIHRFTDRRYKIVCSDAKALRQILLNKKGINDVTVTGANTIIVVLGDNDSEGLRSRVSEAVDSTGLSIYSFEQAMSLEEAYKEIMEDD